MLQTLGRSIALVPRRSAVVVGGWPHPRRSAAPAGPMIPGTTLSGVPVRTTCGTRRSTGCRCTRRARRGWRRWARRRRTCTRTTDRPGEASSRTGSRGRSSPPSTPLRHVRVPVRRRERPRPVPALGVDAHRGRLGPPRHHGEPVDVPALRAVRHAVPPGGAVDRRLRARSGQPRARTTCARPAGRPPTRPGCRSCPGS